MRKFVKAMALAVLIVGLAGGLYVGNLIYTEFMTAPWDVVLGVNDDSRDMSVIKAAAGVPPGERMKSGTLMRG